MSIEALKKYKEPRRVLQKIEDVNRGFKKYKEPRRTLQKIKDVNKGFKKI